MAKTFSEIEKFNPYHDRLGRFTTAGAAASFTYAPGKSKAHDAAIAREKERTAKLSNPGHEFGITQEQHEKLERLVNGSVFAAGNYRKEIGMDDDTYQKYKEKFKSKERADQIRMEREQKRQTKNVLPSKLFRTGSKTSFRGSIRMRSDAQMITV